MKFPSAIVAVARVAKGMINGPLDPRNASSAVQTIAGIYMQLIIQLRVEDFACTVSLSMPIDRAVVSFPSSVHWKHHVRRERFSTPNRTVNRRTNGAAEILASRGGREERGLRKGGAERRELSAWRGGRGNRSASSKHVKRRVLLERAGRLSIFLSSPAPPLVLSEDEATG